MKLPAYPKYARSGVASLGDVPEHWQVKRARFCMRVNPPTDRLRSLGPDDEISFVPMESVREYGGLDLELTKSLSEIETSYTEFEDGDVIVAKITPCFENGKGALAQDLINGVALGTTELHVLRGAPSLVRIFLFYLTISSAYRKTGEAEMYGAGGQKRISVEFTKNFRTPLPPLSEQRAIAGFLNQKKAQLDALMAKKREFIEKLKRKRAALISGTVTRGLKGNVRFKRSGIKWLGDIPEHWEVLPFTKYIAEKSDYRGKTPDKVTAGVFLLTAKNVRMGWIDYKSSQEFVAEEDYDEIMRRGLPKKGDILFTTEAPLGNVALVDREDVALAQRIIRFRVQPNRYLSQFALYAMMSDHFQVQLKLLSTGSTAEGIKASKLHQLRLIAPPLPEQRAIALYLDRETARIDRMAGKVEEAVERLQEYRTALITAAVTGKIDVRPTVEN